ncbi:MAG: FHA domain-containing protein [Candidatus Sericytochromatia bacterium]
MKQIALLQGEDVVKRYTLQKDSYTIGRSKDNDLVFEHPKVSRTHARLYRENGHYVLQDLNSTNYVFVNGVRIKQKKLEPDDRIQISSEIQLIYSEQAEEPAAQDKSRTLFDIQRHFVHKDDLERLKKVTQSVVLLNSLDSILMQILKEGISLTGAERGLIVLTDSKGQILWKYATTYRIDRDKAEAGEADISQSILQEALEQHKTVVRFNEYQQRAAEPPTESMMALKIFSAMCAPLILDNRTIGLFYVDARQLMNNFTEVDQFLFDYLADHAAIAIYNGKRYADLQAETQRLRASLDDMESSHQQLEERHQKLLSQIGQPTKPLKQISTTAAKALSGRTVAHTYSAGGVVLNPHGQVLLVQQQGTSWSLPKGHIEVGEEPAVTAQREIFEESGISYLRLLQSLGSYQRSSLNAQGEEDSQEMKTIYMYLFTSEQTEVRSQEVATTEVRWVAPEEALGLLTHPRDQAFFQGILSDIQAALEPKQPSNADPSPAA